ncbi:MAG: peptidase [Gemmatimonadetes bacterium]|nr:peptidase [Gemmatimonadota bacterium]
MFTLGALTSVVGAQGFTTQDPVIRRLWALGTDSSEVGRLAQVLADSIGPRLNGTTGLDGAQRWMMQTYKAWGIPVRTEKYGTWRGWQRGAASVELLEPRFRSLDARLMAWSPGTKRPTVGKVITLPEIADSAAFHAWLPQAAGKFVLVSTPEMTCRTDASLKQWSSPEGLERFLKERKAYMDTWTVRTKRTGLSERQIAKALEDAGVAGVLTSLWSEGWNVVKIHDAITERVPSVSVSCEDYGLLARLAEKGQAPVLRLNAEATFRLAQLHRARLRISCCWMLNRLPIFATLPRSAG